jgi:hypothetical protein
MASLSDDLSWLKTHLILLAVVAVLTFSGIYGVESLIAKHDAKTASIYQTQNEQFQKQVVVEIAALQQQNQALLQQVATRQQVEVKIPTNSGSLTAPQAADTISKYTLNHPVVPTATGVTVDLATAQAIASDLQMLPLVRQDKADLQVAFTNEVKIYNDEVAAHKKDNDANAEQIKSLKADARKGKLKWFGIGYVAGFVSGVALHTLL